MQEKPKLRFVYDKSYVYGWTVYDRNSGMEPAYTACSELLPPVISEETGDLMSVSCTQLESEYAAMMLCHRLNSAWRRKQRKVAK